MIHCEWFREGEETSAWFYMVGLYVCVCVCTCTMIRGQIGICDGFCACSDSDLYDWPATVLNTNFFQASKSLGRLTPFQASEVLASVVLF